MAYRNPNPRYKQHKYELKLIQKKKDLKLYREAEREILTGGDQSYTIGGTQISRRTYSLDRVRNEIRLLEDEIDKLEDLIHGYTGIRAKRAIPRDW